jgi:long-chain acyl-CoA synthetase
LPRTSTGKVRRREVAAWLERLQKAGAVEANGGAAAFKASADWLLALIAQISGETPHGVGDELRLDEELHLDSLGRVQLAAAIEQRLGIVSGSGLLEEVETLGDLRRLVAGETQAPAAARAETAEEEERAAAPFAAEAAGTEGARGGAEASAPRAPEPAPAVEGERLRFLYPTWPWWKPVAWLRVAFLEAVARPLTWLLAGPRVIAPAAIDAREPILIVANHVTAYDAPLVQYALPGRMRRRIAVAMLGELLEDFRHARNPDDPPGRKRFYILGPPAYWLITTLFNVFPLPRQRDFQSSFAHAGRALDRGYNVMIFPEGTRSAEGQLAAFRPGIGLLTKQSSTAVLPVGIRGLGELKVGRKRWFRSGKIQIRVGEPLRFAPQESEAVIAARLHDEVARLMQE